MPKSLSGLRPAVDRLPFIRSIRATAHEQVTLAHELRSLRSEIDRLTGRLESVGADADAANARADALRIALDRAEAIIDHSAARLDALAATWLAEQLCPVSGPLISVVMATRNRCGLLERSVRSVLDQRYVNWELLVIDDESTDDTQRVMSLCEDRRVRTLAGPGCGASAARNVGLAAAAGDVVAFVDDDNTMHSAWLAAVAAEFVRDPALDAVSGAQIRASERDVNDPPTFALASTLVADDILEANQIDLGALAVRRGHPELRFDEKLKRFVDWELLIRLIRSGVVRPIRVLSGAYGVDAPHRITVPSDLAAVTDFRARLRDGLGGVGVPGRFTLPTEQ